MTSYSLAGLFLTCLASVCLYLASPHQRLRSSPWPVVPACAAGAVLGLLGWLSLGQAMTRLTATFSFLTALMLFFSILPYLGAIRSIRLNREEK